MEHSSWSRAVHRPTVLVTSFSSLQCTLFLLFVPTEPLSTLSPHSLGQAIASKAVLWEKSDMSLSDLNISITLTAPQRSSVLSRTSTMFIAASFEHVPLRPQPVPMSPSPGARAHSPHTPHLPGPGLLDTPCPDVQQRPPSRGVCDFPAPEDVGPGPCRLSGYVSPVQDFLLFSAAFPVYAGLLPQLLGARTSSHSLSVFCVWLRVGLDARFSRCMDMTE